MWAGGRASLVIAAREASVSGSVLQRFGRDGELWLARRC